MSTFIRRIADRIRKADGPTMALRVVCCAGGFTAIVDFGTKGKG